MNTNDFIRKIFLRLAKFKWLIFLGSVLFGALMFFYAKSIYIRKSRFEGIAEGFIAESSSEAKVKFK